MKFSGRIAGAEITQKTATAAKLQAISAIIGRMSEAAQDIEKVMEMRS